MYPSVKAQMIANLVTSGWFEKQQQDATLDDTLPDSCLKVRNMPHKLIVEAGCWSFTVAWVVVGVCCASAATHSTSDHGLVQCGGALVQPQC